SYLGCHVVKTIYSDNTEGKRQIRDMGDTTRLFDMLNGMQELTSFGSVSTLRSYYENTKDVKIDSMLDAMQQLNETLSLCRTGAIKGDTNRFCNALTELKRNCRDPLMEQLLPVFQNKFGENPDELTMILWCVENGMIQQALTIYTERAPTRIMGQFSGNGLERLKARIEEDANRTHKAYTDTVLFFDGILRLAKDMPGLDKAVIRTATLSHLNELLPNSGITCDDVDWVATAGRRYLYIKLIRNMIAHANEVTTQEKQLCDIQRHKDEDCAEYCDLNTLTVAQIGTFLTESVHHLQRKA
ncbi:MAG: TM1812 family CRISPR-associated protein, partial [Oscillospiraceae bacterium]